MHTRHILTGLVATAVLAAPLAAATAAHADTVSSASDCVPVKAVPAWTETLYKYSPIKTSEGPTQWDTKDAPAGTPKTWVVKGKNVNYTRDGNKTSTVPHAGVAGVTCSVTLPEHFVGEGTYSVVVPFVKGVDTFLMGVRGYDEHVAITQDVTVTRAMAGQFWIGHKAQDGYVIANPDTAQWHIDFAFAHSTHANGDVAWDFGKGQVTGTVTFDADATNGGSLDYRASNGMWLHGVVAPGTYQQLDAHTAVFGGEITSGSDDYTVNHEGTDYFTVKIVDGRTPDGHGDVIAVLANQDGFGNWLTSSDPTPSRDYPMDADHAGIVTGGNLVIS
jgi:hypothetical protein